MSRQMQKNIRLRPVDLDLLREFEKEAHKLGLSYVEAYRQAMQLWLDWKKTK